ncbi:hypothetical protein [Nocardiopsis kunsanensis]|uniref:hypothetical protein n=1 Tax=Nocardiopsis kunsanensis TaxID=141693 RepID=UPI000348CABC|nr:hypothetical protein [Nocardiopsis kunsanensis]
MSRVNRPDSLLDQLRDMRRRLARLEASRHQPGEAAALFRGSAGPRAAPPVGGPILPARGRDQWSSTSDTRETVGHTWWEEGSGHAEVLLTGSASADTTGLARVVVDGAPVGPELSLGDIPARLRLAVDPYGAAEMEVQVRRTGGDGTVWVTAGLA